MKMRYLLGLLCLQILVISRVVVGFPDNQLHLVVCDVGQGDAILISYGFQQMLIDGGRDQKVLTCLTRHLPVGDRTIEIVVATHADADHIGGLPQVLQQFKVLNLILTEQGKQTDDFKQFWRLAQVKQSQGMRLINPKQNQVVWQQAGLQAKVLSTSSRQGSILVSPTSSTETQLSDILPSIDSNKVDYNDGSIVILLKFDQTSFLFTGDLEKTGELALIRSGLLSKVNVLKVGHHGSKSSSSAPFLSVLRPEISLISVGLGNRYGHPSSQVLHRLLEVGSATYRTDQLGSIEVVSDGHSVFIKNLKKSKFFNFKLTPTVTDARSKVNLGI